MELERTSTREIIPAKNKKAIPEIKLVLHMLVKSRGMKYPSIIKITKI